MSTLGGWSRRKFLKATAAAPVAAPMAVKEVMEQVNVGAPAAGISSHQTLESNVANNSTDKAKTLKWLMEKGVPEWRKRELWDYAKEVRCLDPDLASMRSFSLSAKIHTQTHRNYKRSLDNVSERLSHSHEVDRFLDTHSLDRYVFGYS